ncbi:hypothetical protein Afil01_52670 [Actinorhabdospora filicis]|uniref:Uncharacterized protein n=1 Tax=Actinorhabdospora filicis TaxID=1785913 RepID=A0A9W6SR54_9ACTN|nr:hypothetical protein [Actinorhabdospora filicis]GLZ80460.1 hypothetical protein Afil01_52670 [Actinorhabdospora filicis]
MFLKAIADALVERLVPRTEAGACCEDRGLCDTYDCADGISVKLCCYSCSCRLICGSCYIP